MPITPLFAAIFGLMFIVLSFSVIRIRFGEKISTGHADHRGLEKAVRIHANFAEYVPLALLLMWFVESISLSSGLVFWLGCILLLARVAHAIGMQNPRQFLVLRQIGVLATFAVIATCCINLVWWYLPVNL